jgi:hypothetical protein
MKPTTYMAGQQSPRSRGKEFHMDKRATLLGRPFSHRDIVVLPGSFARVLLRHFLDLCHDLNEVVGLRVLQRRELYV